MPRLLVLAILLPGCAQFPDLDRAVSAEARAAPPPEIVDLRPLLARLPDDGSGARAAETAPPSRRARGMALGPREV
ncbi:MAG: hypothetical protein GVY27_03860 [Deinococcus-Thermus bacterium]|nr:hypothetical protein [Deinococcota bacterium]